jgi:predicted nucleotidyltransferase
MDYVRPIEAMIPGAQGRVLGVLARTEARLTMRAVASLARVSASQAVTVLNRLVSLGLVERREAGSAAQVRLVRDNEAARAVLAMAGLRDAVIDRLRDEARAIDPAPLSLVIFGSFARGSAREGSDIDVLAVPPAGLVGADDDRWVDALGRWQDRARQIAGNPVNLLLASAAELPSLVRRSESVWESAARDGVLIAGADLAALAAGR